MVMLFSAMYNERHLNTTSLKPQNLNVVNSMKPDKFILFQYLYCTSARSCTCSHVCRIINVVETVNGAVCC